MFTKLENEEHIKTLVTACKVWAYAHQINSQTAMDEAEILIDAVLTKATSGDADTFGNVEPNEIIINSIDIHHEEPDTVQIFFESMDDNKTYCVRAYLKDSIVLFDTI